MTFPDLDDKERGLSGGDLSEKETVHALRERIGKLERRLANRDGLGERVEGGPGQTCSELAETTRVKHEMEAFFNLTPGFHATLGLDGVIKSWSPGWEKNLGYTEAELFDMSVHHLVHELDRSGFEAAFQQAASGEMVTNFETRVLSKVQNESESDGNEAWLSWNLSSDPDLSLVFVSARCVTEQKEALRKLADARIRAEEASRAKNDFLAVMSHELRTPLNPVIGFAELLFDELEDEEQKEMIMAIIQSGEHMLALIDDILDFSKIEAGKARLDLMDFSLLDLIERKFRLMSGIIKDNSIEFVHSVDWGPFDEATPPILKGDVNMIRQVLRNLLANAVKYTKKGRIDLSVSILGQVDGVATVEFAVEDTGIGIPKLQQAELFEPFAQGDESMTREYGGVGLGLAICKRIADLMDAKLTVESEEGQGSRFTFTVPLRFSSSEDDGDSSGASSPNSWLGKGEEKSQFVEKVLVIEDNETNAFFMKRLLNALGVKEKVVSDGESALVVLSEETFALVLLDLHMPGIGGLETLRRLRTHEKELQLKRVPIYVLTADGSREAKEQCEHLGSDGLLTKPVPTEAIRKILREHLSPWPGR